MANNNGGDGPASLSVINGANCDATNTTGCGKTPPAIPGVGRAPNGIAFDPTTHTVYTANFQDATVSVINVTPQPSRPLQAATKSRRRQHARGYRYRHREPHHLHRQQLRGTVSILPEQPVRAPRTAGSATPAPESARVPISHRGQLDHACRSLVSCR